MFFQDLFAGWLAGAGWITLPPGTPDPREPAVAMAMLRDQGCKVFARGIEPPVPAISLDDAKAVLESQHAIVLMPGETLPFDVDAAVAGLKARRWNVMHPIHLPELGLWQPADPVKHLPRHVVSVDGATVHFMHAGEGEHCSLLSFWGWRKRVNATHRPTLDI